MLTGHLTMIVQGWSPKMEARLSDSKKDIHWQGFVSLARFALLTGSQRWRFDASRLFRGDSAVGG